MNFKQLNYFLVVAEEGQITSAAKRLFVGQPASPQLPIKAIRRGARG